MRLVYCEEFLRFMLQGVSMKNLQKQVNSFFNIIKSYGITSFVLILVVMIRSIFFNTPEQHQLNTQLMVLGGFMLIFCAVVELAFKKGKE